MIVMQRKRSSELRLSIPSVDAVGRPDWRCHLPLAIVSMLVSYVQARQLANVSPVAALRDSSAC
jgi:hypothetical protein